MSGTNYVFGVWVMMVFFIANLPAQTTVNDRPAATESEQRRAEKLWEQIIEAKGGREKLHSVTNMVLTKGNSPDNLGVYFDVFPYKSWTWRKGPPTPKVIWIDMVNLDYGVYLTAGNEGLLRNDRVSKERHDMIVRETIGHACVYLLETKWLQPKPVRVERKKIDKELLDVVETQLSDPAIGIEERMDFAVEPETLLVRWVVEYYQGKPLSYYYFDGYTTVDGIQVPLRYGDLWSFTERKYFMPLKFDFNVDYNKQLFEKPPTVEAGSDAWKPKE